jgi:hypothetical protein
VPGKLTEAAQGQVGGNPVQPGRERPFRIELLKVTVAPQKSLLGDIFSLLPISQQPVQDAVHGLLITLDDRFKSLQIASERLPDQFLVGRVPFQNVSAFPSWAYLEYAGPGRNLTFKFGV